MHYQVFWWYTSYIHVLMSTAEKVSIERMNKIRVSNPHIESLLCFFFILFMLYGLHMLYLPIEVVCSQVIAMGYCMLQLLAVPPVAGHQWPISSTFIQHLSMCIPRLVVSFCWSLYLLK